jgi:glutaredoxin
MSFVIIGRNTCGWCLRSKFLLKEKKEKFIFIDLDKTKDVNIFNKKYKKYIPYTLTTIPKILLIEQNKTKLIGGYQDLNDFLENNPKESRKSRKGTKRKQKKSRKSRKRK